MTPRQRVEAVLHGDRPDQVPLTMYECMVPQCTVERQLRNAGLGIVYRTSVFLTHTPNVTRTSEHFTADGVAYVRTVTRTPGGTLTQLDRPAGFTLWHIERVFKGPGDYAALRSLVQDQRFEPCYEDYQRREAELGDDFILRAGIGLTPLHQIMIDDQNPCRGEYLDVFVVPALGHAHQDVRLAGDLADLPVHLPHVLDGQTGIDRRDRQLPQSPR